MTPTLIWQIVQWVLSSIMGATAFSFVYGRANGRRQARLEADIAAATKSRESIHRQIDRVVQRLDKGDKEFARHLERLATLGAKLDGFNDNVVGLRSALAQVATKRDLGVAINARAAVCDERHRRRRTS